MEPVEGPGISLGVPEDTGREPSIWKQEYSVMHWQTFGSFWLSAPH